MTAVQDRASDSFLWSVGLPLRRSRRRWFWYVADADPASPDRHEALGVSATGTELVYPDRRSSACAGQAGTLDLDLASNAVRDMSA